MPANYLLATRLEVNGVLCLVPRRPNAVLSFDHDFDATTTKDHEVLYARTRLQVPACGGINALSLTPTSFKASNQTPPAKSPLA